MPKLVRLYIQSIAVGFALSVLFLGALIGLDIGGLGGLILGSSTGLVAAAMLIVFNGIIFAGAQFAYAIMRMAAPEDGPRGGHRQWAVRHVAVKAEAATRTPSRLALRRLRR